MSGNGGFQEKALQNRSAIAHISPTSNERMTIRTKTLDGRAIAVPPHQVAVLSEQPKVVYVNPQTAVPTAWSGSETYIDFQIPPELHILTGLVLRLPITIAAESTDETFLPHTSYWVSRVEVQAGKDTIETLYPEQLDFHNAARASTEEAHVMGSRTNCPDPMSVLTADMTAVNNTADSTGTNANDYYGIAGKLSSGTGAKSYENENCFYLPLPCSLTQGKVFVSGFITPFRLRVFFPSAVTTSSAAAVKIPVLSNSIQLYCYEQELSAINYEAKLREHRNGSVSYKVIIHDRYVESYPNLSQTSDISIQLKAFKSLSAGLLVQWFPAPANLNDFNLRTNLRAPVKSLELLDNVGRRMTETLRDEWLRWKVWAECFGNKYAQYVPVYVIPFSSDLQETLRNGVNLGYEQLTTLEQLRVQFDTRLKIHPSGGSAYQYNLNITSFNYAMLECNAGVPRVVFT